MLASGIDNPRVPGSILTKGVDFFTFLGGQIGNRRKFACHLKGEEPNLR